MTSTTRLLVWSALAVGALSVTTNCYYPDGSLAKDYRYTLCDGSYGKVSGSCCIPDEGDVCGDNGICNWSGHYLFRGACSDYTWQDPTCAGQICKGLKPGTWVPLKQCTPTLYCCDVTSNCCTDGSNIFSLSNNTAPSTTAATAAAGSSVPSSSSTSGSGSSGESSSGAPIGAIIGGGIGGAVIVLLIGGAIIYFCMRRKTHRPTPVPQEPPVDNGKAAGGYPPLIQLNPGPYHPQAPPNAPPPGMQPLHPMPMANPHHQRPPQPGQVWSPPPPYASPIQPQPASQWPGMAPAPGPSYKPAATVGMAPVHAPVPAPASGTVEIDSRRVYEMSS